MSSTFNIFFVYCCQQSIKVGLISLNVRSIYYAGCWVSCRSVTCRWWRHWRLRCRRPSLIFTLTGVSAAVISWCKCRPKCHRFSPAIGWSSMPLMHCRRWECDLIRQRLRWWSRCCIWSVISWLIVNTFHLQHRISLHYWCQLNTSAWEWWDTVQPT